MRSCIRGDRRSRFLSGIPIGALIGDRPYEGPLSSAFVERRTNAFLPFAMVSDDAGAIRANVTKASWFYRQRFRKPRDESSHLPASSYEAKKHRTTPRDRDSISRVVRSIITSPMNRRRRVARIVSTKVLRGEKGREKEIIGRESGARDGKRETMAKAVMRYGGVIT